MNEETQLLLDRIAALEAQVAELLKLKDAQGSPAAQQPEGKPPGMGFADFPPG